MERVVHKIPIKRLAECPAKAFFSIGRQGRAWDGVGFGRETHLAFREVVKELGLPVVFEKSVLIPLGVGDWGLQGAIDVLLLGNLVDDVPVVIELKSVVHLPEVPEKRHLLQVNSYLHWALKEYGSARAYLVYVLPVSAFLRRHWLSEVKLEFMNVLSGGELGGSFLRAFQVEYSEYLFEEMERRARLVVEASEGKLDVLEYAPGVHCALCEFRGQCAGVLNRGESKLFEEV